MRVRVLRWLRRNPRVGKADPEQGAFCSPLVIEGQRPRWLYRTGTIDPIDSGWRFFEGSESDEWLNDERNCVIEHLGHMPERWPELLAPLEDDRARSAWEWDPSLTTYVEVRGWMPPE